MTFSTGPKGEPDFRNTPTLRVFGTQKEENAHARSG
jgi:hypothetical protein